MSHIHYHSYLQPAAQVNLERQQRGGKEARIDSHVDDSRSNGRCHPADRLDEDEKMCEPASDVMQKQRR